MKKRIAVFFGGRSPEHDVSIVSGLQALSAIDQSQYEAFPVYVTTDGKWLIGDVLRDRGNYMLDKIALKDTAQVTLDISTNPTGRLVSANAGLFGKKKPVEFDTALLVFHGLYGEDGNIQGLLEMAGVAYTGMRIPASSILMDKILTKRILQSADIPMLPYAVIKRPAEGFFVAEDVITDAVKDLTFPLILKPAHLGSSIGIAKVETLEDIQECLPAVFQMDDTAILEPFVENMIEYNVSVARVEGEIVTSDIERPKTNAELLSFKEKYQSGGDNKSGNKLGGNKNALPSEGMLSLTREINPDLAPDLADKIRNWATAMFSAVDGTGCPRIDFIGNSKTGELWLNEVNPIPGSLAFFLWEKAEKPLLFTELLTHLIKEASECRIRRVLPADPVPKDARLFNRPL